LDDAWVLGLFLIGIIVAAALYNMDLENTLLSDLESESSWISFDRDEIVWGNVENGSTVVRELGIFSEISCSLSAYPINFDPPESEKCFNLSWSYQGEILDPDEKFLVYFYLDVLSFDPEITFFSFDVTVSGLENE